MGRLDEALAAHRNAVRIDGEHAGEAIFALGELLRSAGPITMRRSKRFAEPMDLARAEGRSDQVQRAEDAIERVKP